MLFCCGEGSVLEAWCLQLGATKQQAEKDIIAWLSEGMIGRFVAKCEHGFGTQLDAVLRWRGDNNNNNNNKNKK